MNDLTPQHEAAPRIGIISLGCAKALYDSERIISHLRAEGYEFSGDFEGADLVIVNTCAFLDSARAESLQAIGDALNENGKVIVTGCLGAEPALIRESYPDVFAITGPARYEAVVDAVHQIRPPAHDPHIDLLPPGGMKLTPRHYAYLKISEGCNNKCSFCIIPGLRGRLRSRQAADILTEASQLTAAGVKELLIVSQDTPAYGMDIKYAESAWLDRTARADIVSLARELGELGIWIRLHYVYPYGHVDRLVELMAQGIILPYLDVPFQHASPRVLKAMKRPADQERTLEKIARWRALCPELTIRSTFIVGFPGETDEDFEFLLDWLEEAELDRVGCFKYENVVGAGSAMLAGHIDEDTKQERWDRLMAHQQRISARKLERKIGTSEPVIIDSIDDEGVVARTRGDAPDVDGLVYLQTNNPHELQPGMIVEAHIESTDGTDLFASIK